jgi:hypothetical protein
MKYQSAKAPACLFGSPARATPLPKSGLMFFSGGTPHRFAV